MCQKLESVKKGETVLFFDLADREQTSGKDEALSQRRLTSIIITVA